MKNLVDLRHWTDGGTGLTNLRPEDESLYLEAIERLGDPNYVLVRAPLALSASPDTDISLHHINSTGGGCDAFWETLRQVQEEKAQVKAKLSTLSRTDKLMLVATKICGLKVENTAGFYSIKNPAGNRLTDFCLSKAEAWHCFFETWAIDSSRDVIIPIIRNRLVLKKEKARFYRVLYNMVFASSSTTDDIVAMEVDIAFQLMFNSSPGALLDTLLVAAELVSGE